LGNYIRLHFHCDTTTNALEIESMSGGAGDIDYRLALAAWPRLDIKLLSAHRLNQTAWYLQYHVDSVSGPLEQRGVIGVVGWTDSLAGGINYSSQMNSGRMSMVWHRGSLIQPCELAAAYAAVLASEEDPPARSTRWKSKGWMCQSLPTSQCAPSRKTPCTTA
jgi:phage tail sheath gpL-like